MVAGMQIAMTVETPDVAMNFAKGPRLLPDAMIIVDGKTLTAETGAATTTGLIGSAHGLLTLTADRMGIAAAARARTDVGVRNLITWIFLAATAAMYPTCKFSSCKTCTRTLSTGCSEPSMIVD